MKVVPGKEVQVGDLILVGEHVHRVIRVFRKDDFVTIDSTQLCYCSSSLSGRNTQSGSTLEITVLTEDEAATYIEASRPKPT